jgi:uncharacterized protein YqcC (DUF446 family)
MIIHNIEIERYYTLADILLDMEAQLRCLELWENDYPADDALMSTEPFHVDTLRFTQWIQFVLIPRLKVLIEEQAPLPATSDISNYAVEALNGVDFPTHEILRLIKHLDTMLSER